MRTSKHWLPLLVLVAVVGCGTGEQSAEPNATAASYEVPTQNSLYALGAKWKNQDGAEMRLIELRNRPVLMAMVYTNCRYACPIIVHDMKKIAAELSSDIAEELQFVLVSLDPERDDPEALSRFAGIYGLDDRWTLLQGTHGDVRMLATTLGVRYKKEADGQYSHTKRWPFSTRTARSAIARSIPEARPNRLWPHLGGHPRSRTTSENRGTTMEISTASIRDRKVGDVVADDFRLGAVFKKYGIDFCCGGGISVTAACEKKGVNIEELESDLMAARGSRVVNAVDGVVAWDLVFLADYIVNIHHRYVRESLPVLEAFATKVARVHGDEQPELRDIAQKVAELSVEMRGHMVKEERVLFPYVKDLVEADQKGGMDRPVAPFGTARNPIRMMEEEHDHAGALLADIRKLSKDFTPPEWACNTYRALFAKLEEFEEDLHRHVHLENNVLFPRTLQLEHAWA